MSKIQKSWEVDSIGNMSCSQTGSVVFNFDITKIFIDYDRYTLTQKSCIYYGLKQILSDYHDADGSSTKDTLTAMSKMLIDGKVDKTKRVKKSSKVDATAIIAAYHSAKDDAVKAMFKTLLDEQGIYIPE